MPFVVVSCGEQKPEETQDSLDAKIKAAKEKAEKLQKEVNDAQEKVVKLTEEANKENESKKKEDLQKEIEAAQKEVEKLQKEADDAKKDAETLAAEANKEKDTKKNKDAANAADEETDNQSKANDVNQVEGDTKAENEKTTPSVSGGNSNTPTVKPANEQK